jgi:optic atrophy protein 1
LIFHVNTVFSCFLSSFDPRLRPIVLNLSRINFSHLSNNGAYQHRANVRRKPLLQQTPPFQQSFGQSRGVGMLVARAIRGLLKLRYLALGGAIGGGMTLNKKYEEWKDGLPDMKWLDEVLPDNEQWSKFSKNLGAIREAVKDSIEIGNWHFLS